LLEEAGVDRELETDVICYSSPMSADLPPKHSGGRASGQAIFRLLLDSTQLRVLIAHCAATARELADIVGSPLPLSAPEAGARQAALSASRSCFFQVWGHGLEPMTTLGAP